MKYLLAAGVLLFFGITSASAQSSFSNVGRVGGGSSLNSGSSLNGAASNGTVGSGLGSVSSNASKNVQATNPGEFVPSTFEAYDAALTLGESALRARPQSLVEAARLAQQTKAHAAAKPALVLEKNADGNLILLPTSVPASVPESIALAATQKQ